MNPLISVVVPIYNIASYVPECIESILRQTYQDIELILVDDGSTDDSGLLCDKYGHIDTRIRVIHKPNGGLSDARNWGIEEARGEYITFIDGDDTVSQYYAEYLYAICLATKSDISICSLKKVKATETIDSKTNSEYYVYNPERAISEMLYARQFSCSACAKLFRKDLFNDIRFPLGKYSEDMFTTWKLLTKAKCIVHGKQTCYYYRYRPGSILASSFTKRHLDLFDALEEMEKTYDNSSGEEFKKAFAAQYVSAIAETLEKNPSLEVVRESGIWDRAKLFRGRVVLDNRASERNRAMALLSYFGPRIERYVLNIYYHRIKWK